MSLQDDVKLAFKTANAQAKRIAALEAAVLRLLEVGDGMRSALDETNPATWRHEIKAWDEAASAAKGLVGK